MIRCFTRSVNGNQRLCLQPLVFLVSMTSSLSMMKTRQWIRPKTVYRKVSHSIKGFSPNAVS